MRGPRSFGVSALGLSVLSTQLTGTAHGHNFQTYGVVLFRAFDMIDIYGPLEVLQAAGRYHKIDFALISESMDPVTTAPMVASMNPMNSSVWPSLTPTHTFETAPELDVLIIPGGAGIRSPYLNTTLQYIAETAPKVKHIITICTGSALAARAGIMDRRKATTNKSSWPGVIHYGPNTTWIPRARWVEDDSALPPIWSSSGVTSGFDLTFQFVEKYYSTENATEIAKLIEYVRNTDSTNDPFARNDTALTTNSR